MRELNEEQRIAVSHFAGPMLVLAGPGSGKTYTITERIKRLVNEHDVASSRQYFSHYLYESGCC